MKVVLAGAYGRLGGEILKELIKNGHEVVAADMIERTIEGLDKSQYTYKRIDVTNKNSLVGLCDGADALITTVGLTKSCTTLGHYDIDFQGNVNLLEEAKRAGVKHFAYISVIKADIAPDVPMVHAKFLFEEELKKSGMTYVIYRPTGYFYDTLRVFKRMVDNNKVSLLGKKDVSCNVIQVNDFAEFILKTMLDNNKTYCIGGKEIYTYDQIARMCFDAAGKKPVIKRAPLWLFNILARLPKNKKTGKSAIIKFSKFTLTNNMIADIHYGSHSFKQYIYDSFKKAK